MTPFVGRKDELGRLLRLFKKGSASLVAVTGRRRIGKTRLIEEFARLAKAKLYVFTGLPPMPGPQDEKQRDNFINLYIDQFGHHPKAYDWYPLFVRLAEQISAEPTVILFDEISWMASGDNDFLGKLKNAWDSFLSKHPNLVFVLCSSVSMWIETNILSGKGFYGRTSRKISLDELTLPECNELLRYKNFDHSPMEKFKILAVIGGVPYYLDQIESDLSANENIKQLCFSKDGLLVSEFKYIFNDIFQPRRGEVCEKIVKYLAQGPAEYGDISEHLNYPSGGPLSGYLKELSIAGFLSGDAIWDLETGKVVRTRAYRLKDNYLRFYIKYIEPNWDKIAAGEFEGSTITALPGWDSIMGLQFENLVVNNKALVRKAIGVPSDELIFSNPYFQRTTKEQPGCQIDYLIQTRYNNLYVCEIKFSRREIDSDVIKEVEQKIRNLKRPRYFAAIPVLIYVNGVSERVKESRFFSKLIDFGDLLEG